MHCQCQAIPTDTNGLYYKHVTIVNYASMGVNELKASLNDDASHHLRSSYVYSTGHRIAQWHNAQLMFLRSRVQIQPLPPRANAIKRFCL